MGSPVDLMTGDEENTRLEWYADHPITVRQCWAAR
jgi:hypothetical protein